MSLISVIIPVYNTEQFLAKCLDSVLNQAFQDIEVILVDDGSTDSSPVICDTYENKDARVRTFHIKNGGVGNARNYGIKESSSNWICFIDSDDWIETDYLSSFNLDEYQNDDIILQGCICEKDGLETGRKIIDNYHYSKDHFSDCFINNNLLDFGSPCCKLFKRSIIQKNGITFPSDFQYGEDEVFMLRYLFFCKSIQCLSIEKYHYVEHSQFSLSRKAHDSISLFKFIIASTSVLSEIMSDDVGQKVLFRHINKCLFFAQRAICNMYILNYDYNERLNAISYFKINTRPLLLQYKVSPVNGLFLLITGINVKMQLLIYDFCSMTGIIKH